MDISHYIENSRFVQAKRNVLKKVVSRAEETPTFDQDFLNTNLELQKKYQKLKLFQPFFLTTEHIFDKMASPMDPGCENLSIYQTKHYFLIRKSRKLDTFHYFLVTSWARWLT